jgi:hypothetical protein
MNMEIGTEDVYFLFWEYINRNFFTVSAVNVDRSGQQVTVHKTMHGEYQDHAGQAGSSRN